MKKMKQLLTIVVLALCFLPNAFAQYQAPGNFGLTSVLDGAPPAPGTYYMGYLSLYSGTMNGSDGKTVRPNGTDPIKVNTALAINQVISITNTKVAGGNLFFDLLVPVVLIKESNYKLVGKDGLADITIGAGVQWWNKKLFGKPFFHRFELDYILPLGAHNDMGGAKPINAGSQFGTLQPNWAQTLFLNKDVSISLRHHLSFNGFYKGSLPPNAELRVGSYYHVNYSIESIVGKSRFNPGQSGELRLAAQGYYGKQLSDDTMNGVALNSKESVFAIGPDVHYITKFGLALELKTAFELSAVNRTQGTRATFRLVKFFPSKKKN
ncbi:MAG: transporter [Flavobacterium sp.]|nr:transporter [Flavobacterium sp.]